MHHGRIITRPYNPRFYDINLFLKALQHDQIALPTLKIEEFKEVDYSEMPIVIVTAPQLLLKQLEGHYEDLLRTKLSHLEYDEMKRYMPEYLREEYEKSIDPTQ